MEDEEKKENEETPESELLKIQREKYEAIIKDKNKIIKELLEQNTAEEKKDEKAEDEEDEEAEAKKRFEKRQAYYKKNIF